MTEYNKEYNQNFYNDGLNYVILSYLKNLFVLWKASRDPLLCVMGTPGGVPDLHFGNHCTK